MDHFLKPYRECCLHSDPKHVYDLKGWDSVSKLYRLENDLNQKVFVRQHEFTLLSFAGEDLLEIQDGRIISVQELIDGENMVVVPAHERVIAPLEGPSEPRPCTAKAQGPDVAAKVRKPKESQAKAQGEPVATDGRGEEAKAKVRQMLEGVTDREKLAEIAQPILLECVSYLTAKYAHLDNGRYKMTLGNRMVGVLKKLEGK